MFAARAGYEVVGVFRETGSGARVDRAERRKVLALAQRREIDVVLVTELSRWGRSTLDLLHTLQEFEARRVSVIAMSGLAFDLSTPHGRMLATILAGIAEFERELIRERVRSGMAAAKARWRCCYRSRLTSLWPRKAASRAVLWPLAYHPIGFSRSQASSLCWRCRQSDGCVAPNLSSRAVTVP